MAIGPSVRVVGTSFPSNGVLGIQSYCSYQCDGFGPPRDLQVVDEAGAPVTGSLIDGGATASGYWAAWKPDEVLARDTVLEVTETLPSGAGLPPTLQTSVTVTEGLLLDAQAIGFDLPVLVVQTPLGSGTCCVNGPRNSCTGALPCLYDEGTARLRVTVEFTSAPELLGQFAYRVNWSAEGNPTQESEWDLAVRAQVADFEVEASEYCAELEIKRLSDGEVTALEPRCVPHGDAGPLGVTPWPAASNLQALTSCTVPPAEHHADWCAVLDQVRECTADDCTDAKAACAAMPAAMPAAMLPADDAEPVGNGDDTHALGVSESEGGCTVAAPRAALGAGGWLAAAALLLASRRRASRRSSGRGVPWAP